MKRFILVLLAVTVCFANAQTLEKKKIVLKKNSAKDKLADFIYDFTTDKDDNNYYIEYHSNIWTQTYGAMSDNMLAIVDKELNSIKTVVLPLGKGETYHKTFYTPDHVMLLCDKYDKKKKEMNILMKHYSKTTGAYISTTTIEKVKTPSWTPWMYGATSPDETKFGVVFLAENKNEKFDEYHAFLLNREGEILWTTTEKLKVSNEEFFLQTMAVSNAGEISIAFTSAPKNKRSADQMTYIDLSRIGGNNPDYKSIPLDKKNLSDIRLKALRNGNLFFVCLFSEDKDNHPTHLQTVIFDADKFEVAESNISQIPKMEIKSKAVSPIVGYFIPSKYEFSMGIKKIEELDNNELAIVCEQQVRIIVKSSTNPSTPCYLKGVIMTAFANADGVVENYDLYDRFQKSNFRKYVSCYAFSMENQIYYFFNENAKNFDGKSSDKTFDGNKSDNAVIVCNKTSNGTPSEMTFITNKNGSGDRCLQSLLIKDDNRLLIATGNSKEVGLEIINLE
ncbi:MAG: hypothetical protein LBI60_04385 [Bacteroidales bacterium]|jgi:hypothetical protein|nr:hypothetical protein [Bacteroidales bacterium]